MRAVLQIERAGPLTTIQDLGRPGLLAHGVSASGPMDRGAYHRAGLRAGANDAIAIEITRAGIDLVVVEGSVRLGWDGGMFTIRRNDIELDWPGGTEFDAGDRLSITPGSAGNYGYLRFGAAVKLPAVLGSRATSTRAGLGGMDGRAVLAGDELVLDGVGDMPSDPLPTTPAGSPIRFVWGIHAEIFAPSTRQRFVEEEFAVTAMMDRMGVRLDDGKGVFAGASLLSLVSDPLLAGDIQILGDGTPIVLMRDHQSTGGYPRIGTVITADFDRFAQMRPGAPLRFAPVSVAHAQALLRSAHYK